MYCVGLTGTIASGKSTVAALFEKLGIEVINADHIAKALVNRGEPALQQIVNYFGQAVLTVDGDLNRRLLRDLIVNDVKGRLWLEALLHPFIRKQIQQDIGLCKGPYCVIEIPLLIDRTDYPYLNRVLLVTADSEQQIARLMTRDHCSREDACAMLETTRADEHKRQAIADDVLVNDGTVDGLQDKVAVLYARYLQN